MNKLSAYFSRFSVGPPQMCENLTVYPLHFERGQQRKYQTFPEALDAETFEITLESEGHRGPSLTASNSGKMPVLLVVGEEVWSDRQDFVLNRSLLVPAEGELHIPATYLHTGPSWSYREPEESASSSARQRDPQSKVAPNGVTSPARKLREVYVEADKTWVPYTASFAPPDAQGIIVDISGKIVGADIFEHTETLHKLWSKLIGSYALDALALKDMPGTESKAENAKAFLDTIQQADDEIFDSAGEGKDLRLTSKHIVGSSLVWSQRVIHTSIFSVANST